MASQAQMNKMSCWGVQDVINYLSANRLQEFSKYFRENKIDGYHFANLTKTEIHNMPRISNTKKRDLWKVVNNLQGKKPTPAPAQSVETTKPTTQSTTVNHQQKDFDDFSDEDGWGSEFDDDDGDDDDDEDLLDYQNENFKQATHKKQQRKPEYEDATIKPNQPGFLISSAQDLPSEIYANEENPVKQPDEDYMDMNNASKPWLVNQLTAALQSRTLHKQFTKGSANNDMAPEDNYIGVLQDEDCPPPIPSRQNQRGRPSPAARLSPVPAHKLHAVRHTQRNTQELYIEPLDDSLDAPRLPHRPPHTLPLGNKEPDPDEDYIEPDVEIPAVRRVLPAIPNQAKLSPTVHKREINNVPVLPKREKSPVLMGESRQHKTTDNVKKRNLIPPPPTTKNRNGPKENQVLPVASRKPMQTPSQGLETFPWYHKNATRQTAEPKFKNFNRDGVFIIRDSEQPNQPYTLMVFKASETKVYNLPVRQRPHDKKFALGGSKKDEQTFESVPDMIEHFLKNTLIVGAGANQGEVTLSVPLPKK